jgi:thiamine-phosphate pyrophosphorylase
MTLPAPLLFIADLDEAGTNILSILHGALSGGCRWVLLRGKNSDAAALLATAKHAKRACTDYSAKLFISGDVALARSIKADGLHLPSDATPHKFSIPGMLIGQSCHNEAEMRRAESSGMNYVSLSPIFTTSSKPGYGPALGLEKLSALAKKTTLPVVALGGISVQNIGGCLAAGAQAVAVMGGILRTAQPKSQTEAYLRAVKNVETGAGKR